MPTLGMLARAWEVRAGGQANGLSIVGDERDEKWPLGEICGIVGPTHRWD